MKFKIFTIEVPSKETNLDGSLTNYEINQFLNNEEVAGSHIQPTDVSCEFNEETNLITVSIGYKEEKSLLKTIGDFVTRKKGYQIRFSEIGPYLEKRKDVAVYLQLQLENAVNYNEHESISHGIFINHHTLWVAFLEHQVDVEAEA